MPADNEKKETKYVVLGAFVGSLTRGDLVSEEELPTSDPKALIAEGSIRKATAAETKAGVNVDPSLIDVAEEEEVEPAKVEDAKKADTFPVIEFKKVEAEKAPTEKGNEP